MTDDEIERMVREAEELGPMGRLAGKMSQVFYAVYLEPGLAEKHMLLQDSARAGAA